MPDQVLSSMEKGIGYKVIYIILLNNYLLGKV